MGLRREKMKLPAKLSASFLFWGVLSAYSCWAGPGSDTAQGLMTVEQVVKDSHEGAEYIGNEELIKRINANPRLVLLDVRINTGYRDAP